MNTNRGFTLIELMIVVAIIAIMTAIGIPAYQGYVQSSYRANAKADLQDAATRAERYRTVRFTYNGIDSTVVPTGSPFSGGTSRYAVVFTVTGSGAGYEIKATSNTSFSATKKEVIKLRNDGQRCISAFTASVTDCTYGTDPSW